MPSGREAISLAALQALLEKVQQKSIEPDKLETILGVDWRVFHLGIPLAERPAYLAQDSDAPVFLVATVHYRPHGVVTARDVGEFVEKNRRALIRYSVVLASADGFTRSALEAFRRGKTLDYLSETHWPKQWPKSRSS